MHGRLHAESTAALYWSRSRHRTLTHGQTHRVENMHSQTGHPSAGARSGVFHPQNSHMQGQAHVASTKPSSHPDHPSHPNARPTGEKHIHRFRPIESFLRVCGMYFGMPPLRQPQALPAGRENAREPRGSRGRQLDLELPKASTAAARRAVPPGTLATRLLFVDTEWLLSRQKSCYTTVRLGDAQLQNAPAARVIGAHDVDTGPVE